MYPDEWQEEPTVDRSNDTQSDKVELSIVRTRYEEYRRNFIRKQVCLISNIYESRLMGLFFY